MKPSQNAIELIALFEGLSLEAYPDPASGGEPITIGFGTTIYDDGTKVKLGDVITKERAKELLAKDVEKRSEVISVLVKDISLNQNQFDALVSFAYNLGTGALKTSTLLKKIKVNPDDPDIKRQFSKWVIAAGRTMPGLVKRREKEAELYFTTEQPELIEIGFGFGK